MRFYQNVTVLDDGGPAGISPLLKKSWKQATLWPGQNHLVLAILAGFGFYVFLNWAVTGLMLPHLVKMLFGIESIFTRSTFSLLNTTFFAGMLGLTYLCVDPILKTVYVLRCFYGESLESGEDLRAELNSATVASQSVGRHRRAPAGTVLRARRSGRPTRPCPPPPPATPPVSSPVQPADLDRAINQTIHEDKYTWRMPREKIVEADAQEGMIAQFFDKVGTMLRKWARAVADWLDKWWRKLSRTREPTPAPGSPVTAGSSRCKSCFTGWSPWRWRHWRSCFTASGATGRTPTVVASEPIQPVPDINDENVGADQLPEDGWTKLARELLERGELRLALRAFYFASLSHLASRNLISIARFKSNRDYERELRRRGHSFPDLLSVFGDNLGSFERIWYGLHEVNPELVDRFAANVERMKAAG